MTQGPASAELAAKLKPELSHYRRRSLRGCFLLSGAAVRASCPMGGLPAEGVLGRRAQPC